MNRYFVLFLAMALLSLVSCKSFKRYFYGDCSGQGALASSLSLNQMSFAGLWSGSLNFQYDDGNERSVGTNFFFDPIENRNRTVLGTFGTTTGVMADITNGTFNGGVLRGYALGFESSSDSLEIKASYSWTARFADDNANLLSIDLDGTDSWGHFTSWGMVSLIGRQSDYYSKM